MTTAIAYAMLPLILTSDLPSPGCVLSYELAEYLNDILSQEGFELVGFTYILANPNCYERQFRDSRMVDSMLDYVARALFDAIAPCTGNPEECQVILPVLRLRDQYGLVTQTSMYFDCYPLPDSSDAFYPGAYDESPLPDSSDAFYPGAYDESSTVPALAAEEVESPLDSPAPSTVEARDESSPAPSTVEARDEPLVSSAPFIVEVWGDSLPDQPVRLPVEAEGRSSPLATSTLQEETQNEHVPRHVSKDAALANGVSNLPEKCYLNRKDTFGPVIRQLVLPKNWGKRERSCLFGRRNTDPKTKHNQSYDGALDIVDQTGVKNIYVFYDLEGDDIHSIDVDGVSLAGSFRVQGDTVESVDEAVRRMLLRVDRLQAKQAAPVKHAKLAAPVKHAKKAAPVKHAKLAAPVKQAK